MKSKEKLKQLILAKKAAYDSRGKKKRDAKERTTAFLADAASWTEDFLRDLGITAVHPTVENTEFDLCGERLVVFSTGQSVRVSRCKHNRTTDFLDFRPRETGWEVRMMREQRFKKPVTTISQETERIIGVDTFFSYLVRILEEQMSAGEVCDITDDPDEL